MRSHTHGSDRAVGAPPIASRLSLSVVTTLSLHHIELNVGEADSRQGSLFRICLGLIVRAQRTPQPFPAYLNLRRPLNKRLHRAPLWCSAT